MTDFDPKADLRRYLQEARNALLWKLEGLSEYDARRPLVPTGTNLLGLVKHTASVEAGYLGDCFGRPFPTPMPWMDTDAEDNADMWATTDESIEHIAGFYRRVWAHSDATIEALDLDAPGSVPWWGEGNRDVTLHRVLVHVIAETHRHAGHADLVRELVDGSTGVGERRSNMPDWDGDSWSSHYRRLEEVARSFRAAAP